QNQIQTEEPRYTAASNTTDINPTHRPMMFRLKVFLAGVFPPADSAASSAIRVYRCQLLELYPVSIHAATLFSKVESKSPRKKRRAFRLPTRPFSGTQLHVRDCDLYGRILSNGIKRMRLRMKMSPYGDSLLI